MDDRQRRIRIERMKREKQLQLKRRKQQQVLIRRSLTVAAAVAVVLLVVTVAWGMIKPLVKKAGSDSNIDKTSVEVQAGPKEGDKEQEEAPAGPEPLNDGEAGRSAISENTKLNYAVPGWQVDDSGWWYANEDNTYYQNGWLTMDDKQYFFDQTGYMQTGWVPIGGKGCFFSDSGVYEPDKTSKMIALTFDDGPGNYTAQLLEVLEQYNARATFFMVGERIAESTGEEIAKMKALGCQLGNHSYSHPNLTQLSEEQIREQFTKTDELIAQFAGGDVSTVARTPYGAEDTTITSYIGTPCIYWNEDTLDWKTRDVSKNISTVMDRASDGDILLMHDIWPETVEACKTIIPQLIDEGYELVTVSELARAKGVDMQDGVTYYDFTADTLNRGSGEEE